jgi:hypothetical protein
MAKNGYLTGSKVLGNYLAPMSATVKPPSNSGEFPVSIDTPGLPDAGSFPIALPPQTAPDGRSLVTSAHRIALLPFTMSLPALPV